MDIEKLKKKLHGCYVTVPTPFEDSEGLPLSFSAINEYVKFYNNERMHQSLQYFTPAKVYYNNSNLMVEDCIS